MQAINFYNWIIASIVNILEPHNFITYLHFQRTVLKSLIGEPYDVLQKDFQINVLTLNEQKIIKMVLFVTAELWN